LLRTRGGAALLSRKGDGSDGEELSVMTDAGENQVGRIPRGDGGDAAADGDPDVLLDVSQLSVDEISLEVEDLHARVSLQADVLQLLKLHVGVDAELGRVNLTIKGVEAKALLKVRLDNVARIIDRVLKTIDDNPDIVGHLLERVGDAVGDVGSGAGGAVGELGAGAGSAVEDVGDAVGDVGRSAGSAVEDVGGAVGDVGRTAGDALEGEGDSAAPEEDDSAEERPTARRRRRSEGSGPTRSGRASRGSRGRRPEGG
jgi:hypothetical protein